ncbi:MAG TPA: response regulator, partial [Hyphomicrobiales bacterium]|nr:response regulator [Hyphomicrobiales bacterium]
MAAAAKPIKVLVIDDSAVVRKLLSTMLAADPQIDVVGTAHDAYIAREKIKRLRPDVLTLDVEMPRMDGLTFLGNLMRLHPLPVVMVSTLTAKGADVTLDALELGAVDFVCKPKLDLSHTFDDYAEEVIAKVKQAARARVRQRQAGRAVAPVVLPSLAQGQDRSHGIDEVFPKGLARRWRGSDQLIAIGASTGGTEAIREVLQRFPLDVPGIVVAQHIPAGFSKAFADRLDAHCAIKVCQAGDGDPILP